MESTAAGEGTSYGGGRGGAGGKFRKRLFRRPQTTPYERPPTALRHPGNNGWLPKLVDPASKLISASAHMFFSSVFRKRLPPPSPTEANQESRDRLREAVPNPPGVQGPALHDSGNPTTNFDGSGISELEQILKQKTFTRSEVDRLTELLHSKTVDLSNGDEDKRSESNVPQPVCAFERQDEFASTPIQENRIDTNLESHRFHGRISTSGVNSLVIEEDVASPAELAKAYMGSRPSQVSPSMLGLRSEALRDDANVPFSPMSPIMSLVKKPAVRAGFSENGFMTPRSRGRSAIYNMTRTPYSRVNPTATQKGTGSTYDGCGGPSASSSSSQYGWEPDGHHGSKQLALKRRSSVFKDDIGSVGPIRRLRQKTNLSTAQNLSLPVSGSPLSSRGFGFGSDTAQPPMSSTKKPLSSDEPKHGTSKTVGENEDNSIPSTSYTPVPLKSTEMATRILQQLEKLVPKEKSRGKVVAAREKSPSKLTANMLNGQALGSLEDVDSSKIVQNAQYSHKLEDLRNTCLPDARDTSSQKEDKFEENGPKKFVISCEKLASAVISDTTVSVKHTKPGVKNADSATVSFLTLPQKKRTFQMSAYEDFVELDDEIHSNEAASTLLAEGKEKLETAMVESKAASTEAVTVNRTPKLSEIKPPAGPVMKKSTDLGTYDASAAGEKNTGLTFPTAPASSATPQSTSAFDEIVLFKQPNAPPPLFSSSSKNLDKVTLLTFSSLYSLSESLGLKSSAPSEPKPESSNSLANVASGATDTVPKIPQSDTGDIKNTKISGDIMANSETSRSSAVSTSISASSNLSFGAPANNSSLCNGSLASSPVFSSCASVLASGHFTNETFTNSFTNVASSTAVTMTTNGITTTTALNCSLSDTAAPSFLAAPIFKFGSNSVATSNSVSTVSTTSSAEATDLKAKTEKETTIGNLSSSPFGGTSLGMASTESSIFGFSASASTSSANNLSQGSLFGTSSGSLVGTQVSPAGTGVATVMQSMPFQFGSSASSPVFGTSGTTSFSSSSSLFGPSTSSNSLLCSSTPKMFGSSTSFGLNSLASSSETNSISSSGANSSLFGSSWQPTTSSILNSTFSSVSPSTGFSFGASSISVAATNSAPMVFGSSSSAPSGSIFSFTSAAAASSEAQPVFGSSLPVFPAAAGNGDQMNMEDSMAEDPVHAFKPVVPALGQPPISTSSGSVFGSTAPSVGLPFQFGGQQNQSTPQNQSPFQTSSGVEFGAGGSFSLGSGGGDKSTRRIVRVKHKNRRM